LPRVLGFLTIIFLGGLGIPGVVEVQASHQQSDTMAILYTGDGGWQATDRGLAQILADHGIPVLGLNTLRYFWSRRTPQESAADFSRLAENYLNLWHKKKLIVIGYSFGADVLPFILSRVPESLLTRVELLALLAPTRSVDLEFHLSQWFSGRAPAAAKPVLPELVKLRSLNILAFCGKRDGETLCRDLPPGLAKTVLLHAGHRFDRQYKVIAQDILEQIRSGQKPIG
jgi:type IV secretory pathway VirJ component